MVSTMIDHIKRQHGLVSRFAWQLAMTTLMVASAASAQSTPPVTGNSDDRRARLLEELRDIPIVDVIGVVDATGVGAAKSRGEEQWTLVFQLPAWRYADQALRSDMLTVRQIVNRAEFEALRTSLPPYRLVRLRAHLAEKNLNNRPEALLVEIVDANAVDAELARAAEDLQKPVTFDDPTLGHLTFDRRIHVYQGKARWRKQDVRVVLPARSDSERNDALATARTLFDTQTDWDRRVRALVIAKLLPLKNDAWLQDGESRLTAKSFEALIRLQAIHVEREGRVQFWYSDGDMFGGHSIQVRGTLTDGPVAADLAG